MISKSILFSLAKHRELTDNLQTHLETVASALLQAQLVTSRLAAEIVSERQDVSVDLPDIRSLALTELDRLLLNPPQARDSFASAMQTEPPRDLNRITETIHADLMAQLARPLPEPDREFTGGTGRVTIRADRPIVWDCRPETDFNPLDAEN